MQALMQAMRSIPVPYVLIVESDTEVAEMLREVLNDAHISSVVASGMRDVWRVMGGQRPQLLLIDAHLMDGDGIELYDQFIARKTYANIPAVIMSTQLAPYQPLLEQRDIAGLELPVDIDEFTRVVVSLLPSQLV